MPSIELPALVASAAMSDSDEVELDQILSRWEVLKRLTQAVGLTQNEHTDRLIGVERKLDQLLEQQAQIIEKLEGLAN